MLGRPDLYGLAGILADRIEWLIALPSLGAEALDVNRLGRPAERFRRVDRGVHQSRGPAGVEMRPLRLAKDERGDVELLSQAVVVEMDSRVVLEPQKRDEGSRLGVTKRVMELDALFEQLEMSLMGQQWRNANAARYQQMFDCAFGRGKAVRGHGDGEFAAALHFLVQVLRTALEFCASCTPMK